MTTYAPTTQPGQIRRRSRYQGHRTPLGQAVQIEVLEEDVVRLEDGTEAPLRDRGSLPLPALDLTDPAVLAQEFPEFNPATNAPTGRTLTVGEVFAGYFSWIHHHQLLRDQAEASAAANTPTPEPTP